MDNFKAVYKILSALERGMDYPQFDIETISPDRIGVSKERWTRYMEMLSDMGYVKGVSLTSDLLGETYVSTNNLRITLKGLEYLQDNSIMQRMYKAAKGIVDLVSEHVQ